MRQTNRLRFAFIASALCAGLAIAAVACSSGSGSSNSTPEGPTSTPFYPGTEPFPTPENLPVPTLTGEPTVTASGLQIYDIQIGEGTEAQSGSIVYVNYTEWVQGGNQVDKTQGVPVRYRLTKGQIIDGLAEGLVGMRVGGRRILIIPPDLAYGAKGSGNVIPPNATLIYDAEMTTAPTPGS